METPQPINIKLPDFIIPGPSVNWAYQQFTELILDAIEREAVNMADDLTAFWAVLDSEQNAIWQQGGFDLVTAMGQDNPLLPLYDRTLAYEQMVWNRARGVLAETIRLKDLKLYITTRLQIEKQRQGHYADQKAVEVTFVKDLLSQTVEYYNLLVKQYAIYADAVRVNTEGANKVADALNNLRLKEVEQAVENERVSLEVMRADAAEKRSQVRIAEAKYAIAKAQIDGEEAILRAQLVMIEAMRLTTEVLIKKAELVVEVARQHDLVADIKIIQAQSDELRVYDAEIAAVYQQLAIVRQLAAEKITALDQILAEKTVVINELQTTQQDYLTAQREYVDKEVLAAQEELEVQNAEGDRQIAMINARGEAEITALVGDLNVEALRGTKEIRTEDLRAAVEIAHYFSDERIEDARAKVAETLAKAKIINRFTEIKHF